MVGKIVQGWRGQFMAMLAIAPLISRRALALGSLSLNRELALRG